jgi:hypothetical protein
MVNPTKDEAGRWKPALTPLSGPSSGRLSACGQWRFWGPELSERSLRFATLGRGGIDSHAVLNRTGAFRNLAGSPTAPSSRPASWSRRCRPIMENYGLFLDRLPAGRAGPATICPMRRPRP